MTTQRLQINSGPPDNGIDPPNFQPSDLIWLVINQKEDTMIIVLINLGLVALNVYMYFKMGRHIISLVAIAICGIAAIVAAAGL